jgi:UDP-N-acetylglucosamine 2-epimerase (non-hydrolysing)
MHILHVVGARPNFVKAAAVVHALEGRAGITQTLVHTGQHYDKSMSDVFFQQLELKPPEVNLEVGSASHAQQTAQIVSRFEPVVISVRPDRVLVYGDVNSTLAAALVCAKLGVPVGHVEAGLRSRDRSMPEEINRLLTDQVSEVLFCPSEDAVANLQREGVMGKVHLVGNVMIDTLLQLLPQADRCVLPDLPARFALVTLHRPSNADDPIWLPQFVRALADLDRELTVIFPVHPRTRQRLTSLPELSSSEDRLRFFDPLPYLEFLSVMRKADVVITDSGGVQEETSFLGVPCLTVRENTERPITVELGTNQIVGRDLDRMLTAARQILAGQKKSAVPIPLWDGHAAERVAEIIAAM